MNDNLNPKQATAPKLWLVPFPIVPNLTSQLTSNAIGALGIADCFIAEEIKTARRLLVAANLKHRIDETIWLEMRNLSAQVVKSFLVENVNLGKRNFAVVSEAGYPCLADPGALVVTQARKLQFNIIPIEGPSSILMALIASGFNGQQFAFNGYIPLKEPDRQKYIQKINHDAQRGYSQIFIETPYRNSSVIASLTKNISPNLWLSVSVNIGAPDAVTHTYPIAEWSKHPELPKAPAVFVLGQPIT